MLLLVVLQRNLPLLPSCLLPFLLASTLDPENVFANFLGLLHVPLFNRFF
jgi:hypothetical protein